MNKCERVSLSWSKLSGDLVCAPLPPQGQCLLLCNSAVALLNNPAALRQACKVRHAHHCGSVHCTVLRGLPVALIS